MYIWRVSDIVLAKLVYLNLWRWKKRFQYCAALFHIFLSMICYVSLEVNLHRTKSNHLYCFSQIPNPLFDLAGITCGHFLVPFWTFFGATLIGKAVIKMHIQVSCCSLVIIVNTIHTIIIIHPCKNSKANSRKRKKQNKETPIKYCWDHKVHFHRTGHKIFYHCHSILQRGNKTLLCQSLCFAYIFNVEIC